MHLPPIGASRRVACRSGEEVADLKGVAITMQIRSRRVACRSGKELANLKGVTMQIRSRTCMYVNQEVLYRPGGAICSIRGKFILGGVWPELQKRANLLVLIFPSRC